MHVFCKIVFYFSPNAGDGRLKIKIKISQKISTRVKSTDPGIWKK